MIGASLLLGGLVFLAIKPRLRPWAIAILVGMGVLAHYNAALMKRDDWTIQKQVWWQLSWRAPSLEKATLLFLKPPSLLDFAEGYQAWAPANLIYYPDSEFPHPQWGDPGPLLLALSARRHPQAQDAPRDLDQPQFCPPAGAEHAG